MLVFVLRTTLEIDCNHVTRYMANSLHNPSTYVYMFVFLRFLVINFTFILHWKELKRYDKHGGRGKEEVGGFLSHDIYISN
jgi:hypothetical protein